MSTISVLKECTIIIAMLIYHLTSEHLNILIHRTYYIKYRSTCSILKLHCQNKTDVRDIAILCIIHIIMTLRVLKGLNLIMFSV